VASVAILTAALSNAASARHLMNSDAECVAILAAVHRLNANDSDLKDYRYYVVDLVKDHDTAFVCARSRTHEGRRQARPQLAQGYVGRCDSCGAVRRQP
jgi:hypothetical protein